MTLRLNNDNGNSASIDYVDGVSTDVNIEFPEASGTVALVGAAGGLAGNISQATTFRLTGNFNTDNAVITGWEIPNTAGQVGGVGDQVTESNGVFTLPSTGIWLVGFYSRAIAGGTDSTIGVLTDMTQDGGADWDTITQGGAGASGDSNATCSIISYTICDVTNTANDQFRFRTQSFDSVSSVLLGTTADTQTAVLFLRLGDT